MNNPDKLELLQRISTPSSEARSGRETSGDRHNRIYRTIRERISLLIYPPNSVIGETELAGEFKVSRTPIRRVLQRLHFEGLVDIRTGVGTVVTDIDLKTMKEVYDLRMYLTELSAELSPSEIEAVHIDAMENLLVRAENLHGRRDAMGYARLCNDLHELLISLIGSVPLREISDNLYYRSARIWISMLPNLDWNQIVTDQVLETSEMLAAMKRNDLRGMVQVRRFYLHCVLTRISDYLQGNNATSDNGSSRSSNRVHQAR